MTPPDATSTRPPSSPAWHEFPVEEVEGLGTSAERGLTAARHRELLAAHGPNEIQRDRPPSVLQVALTQLRDPMTLMLIVVAVISFVIAQASTAWMVLALVALNVILGTNQEMKAQASVSALARLQVPQASASSRGARWPSSSSSASCADCPSPTSCSSESPWRSPRSRPGCRPSSSRCSPSVPASSPTPRRSSATSPTSRLSARRVRSTPTRPARSPSTR